MAMSNKKPDTEPYKPGDIVRFRALAKNEAKGDVVELEGRIRTRHAGGIHDDLETIATYQIIVDEGTDAEETYEVIDHSQIIDE